MSPCRKLGRHMCHPCRCSNTATSSGQCCRDCFSYHSYTQPLTGFSNVENGAETSSACSMLSGPSLSTLWLISAGAAVLKMSSDGRCCSIVWPASRRYAVYAQGSADDWHKVDEESGTSVAWAGASSTYAVLHQPKVTAALWYLCSQLHSLWLVVMAAYSLFAQT